jgi:hypothetical protein
MAVWPIKTITAAVVLAIIMFGKALIYRCPSKVRRFGLFLISFVGLNSQHLNVLTGHVAR